MRIFFLAVPCGLWDLSSPPGIEPGPSAVRTRSPNHWTTYVGYLKVELSGHYLEFGIGGGFLASRWGIEIHCVSVCVTALLSRSSHGCLFPSLRSPSLSFKTCFHFLLIPLTSPTLFSSFFPLLPLFLTPLPFFNWLCRIACGTLVPQPGVEPEPPAVEAWSPT